MLESLDQVGAVVALVPEWAGVQARSQRNAYHRFTVDRHLLECVAECAGLLGAQDFDGEIARRSRTDLLLLGVLLHDIGKTGAAGDHSERGADTAHAVLERMGLDAHGVDVVTWLVRHHLLLADTATRRDLGDPETIERCAADVQDTERLDLLYALTVGDSRATGPSAWSRSKAALLRRLHVETDLLLTQGEVGLEYTNTRAAIIDRHRGLLSTGSLGVAWSERDDGLLECAVVAPDRRGLLATVAGVLTLDGFDIQGVDAFTAPGEMALEVYRGVDTFGRLDDAAGRAAVCGRRSRGARRGLGVAGTPLRATPPLPRPRGSRGRRSSGHVRPRRIELGNGRGDRSTRRGRAPRAVAAVFADLDLDVTVALVSTTGRPGRRRVLRP